MCYDTLCGTSHNRVQLSTWSQWEQYGKMGGLVIFVSKERINNKHIRKPSAFQRETINILIYSISN